MAKVGKLESTEDSDEETEKFRVVSKRKRAIQTIIISSDEEAENSSDLSSLPPSPAPVGQKFLEEEKDVSEDDKAAERVEATGDYSGSIGKIGGTSNRDDEDVMVLEGLAQNITSPPSVLKKTVPVERKKEDSDNDSIYEITPPVQARRWVGSMKKIPYNTAQKNSLAQHSTILAARTNPGNRIVHPPSTSSSSRTHAPHSSEPSSAVKLKILLSPKLAPRRLQKKSSDIMSWNQSKRVQPAPSRPLLLPKPTGDIPKSLKPAKTAATLKPTRIPISLAIPSEALLPRFNRPLFPLHSSSKNSSLVAVASGSASVDLAPPISPAKPAEIETVVGIAAPIPASKSQEGADMDADLFSDTSFRTPEGNEDVASTTSPTEDSRISVESSTPEQHTYILTSEYDRQLYRAVRSHWAPLAQMREQLANARLAADPDEESEVESGSEGGADLTTKSGRWYGGLGHGWKSGYAGVLGMEIMSERGNLGAQPERTHSTEENVSVAMAMRRYTERLWSGASNEPTILAGAPLIQEHGQADGVEEKEENTTPSLLLETSRLLENPRERSEGLTTRSSNGETPAHTQPVALFLSGDPSTTPVPLDTPTAEPSNAATLVNLSTTPKDSTSPPAIFLTPPESVSWVSQPTTPVRSPIQPPTITYHASDSRQTPSFYDFSYESTAMHIGPASLDANSFAMVRTIATYSKSVVQPDSPIQIELPDLSTQNEPPSPGATSYRPTRHFLGVEPPSIPGTKRYALDVMRGLVEGHEAVEAEKSFSEVEDLSESELNSDALAAYQAIRFYQAMVKEDQEAAKETRKRKTLDSESSALEGEPEHEGYAGPKKKVQRGSRKRRKTIPPIDSDSLLPTPIGRSVSTARPLRLRATGMTVEVPLGPSVDDIDPASLEVRQARDAKVSTTALCHQCRCQNTTEQRKAQCGNVTIHPSSLTSDTPGSIAGSVRCNKTFCERCLRGWYGFDDDAVAFVRGGQRMTEGTGTGTGIGLGIVEGKWICPFCIDLCMCTLCSKKRNVERMKYAPSGSAMFAVGTSGAAVCRPRSTGGVETRRKAQNTVDTAEGEPQALPPIHPPVIRLPRRIGPPPVPTQWLPTVPTPTPGLDPIFYEATRPCTRDFPTGAPQPTAANHAPILYHVGADLENDGLEDSFTGSEMSENEERGESRVSDHSAWIGSSGNNQHDAEVTASSVVAQATRKNFLIVKPGRRMPSTMKKTQEHPKELVSPSLPTPDPPTIPGTPQEPDQVLYGIAHVSLDFPAKSYSNMEPATFDHYPATVDPMQLFGSGLASHAEESPTHSPSSTIGVAQVDLNVSSQHTGPPRSENAYLDLEEVIVHHSSEDDENSSVDGHCMPHLDDYEMDLREEVQIGFPTLTMGDYNDFLPIMGGDDNVAEGIDFPMDTGGDVLLDDGIFSLLVHPPSHQDPDLLAVDLLGYHD